MNTRVATAVVVFGDVIDSRREPVASSAWLRELSDVLEGAYAPSERVAPFGFTQGDAIALCMVNEPGLNDVGREVRKRSHDAPRFDR